jgi:predicted 2-oxoglutarate/Fe(II)-dependent dioxygenase YbiX
MFDGQRKGIPTLTVLGGLNDDYEGGELMMFGDKQIYLPSGSVIVFPSNFMYPHEVKPVKSGIRYSYVSWSW